MKYDKKITYYERAEALATRDDTPTLTDQAAADGTDINVIVGQFLGQPGAPGTTKQPMFEDFSELPTDLRGFFEVGMSMQRHVESLPPELQALTVEQLMNSTGAELAAIMHAAKQPAKPTDEPK